MLLEKDFIGKKVYVKSGESFDVIACAKSILTEGARHLSDFQITLINDKTYSIIRGLLKGTIKFNDDQFQNLVQEYVIEAVKVEDIRITEPKEEDEGLVAGKAVTIGDVKIEQKRFWRAFDQKLKDKGHPFYILHEKAGEVTYWAVVNKNNSFVDNALSIDFLVKEQKLRINIYVRNDLSLFRIFERNKLEIEKFMGVKLNWMEGSKNQNTRRLAYIMPIATGYYSNYDKDIEKVLPIIDKMKKVCERYAKFCFFDF